MSEWNYTQAARAWSRRRGNPEGIHDGLPIIGRGTAIDRGIDIRSTRHGAESIVINSDGAYKKQYEEMLARFYDLARGVGRRRFDPPTSRELVRASYQTVLETMSYEKLFVNAINCVAIQRDAESAKVDLGHYMQWGAGVCRHMALCAGYLLQNAYESGFTDGWASADNNYTPSGGHAWARFEDDSNVYIVDPAQNYHGTLERSALLGRWDYIRPDELGRVTANLHDLGPIMSFSVKMFDNVDFGGNPRR